MFDELIEELHGLSDAALDERLREIELRRRRLDAELAALIAVAEHRQVPAIDGHRSTNAYLRATINCSSAEASRLRRLARAVDHVEGLGHGWVTGRFGSSQACKLAAVHANRRVRDQLAEFAPMLLDHAEQLPYPEFVVCADRFVTLADSDGAHDAHDDAMEHREARVGEVGGMLDVSAHGGDGITAAELIAIHRRFTEAEYRKDLETRRAEFGLDADRHPLSRTGRQRRFDALTAIFRTAAGATAGGSRTEPLVNIVIDAASWAHVLVSSGLAPATGEIGGEILDELMGSDRSLTSRRCETSTGIQLHPHDVLRAALAGHVRRVVVDSAGVVIDFGRRQRLYAGAAREAAKLLLIQCEHPGCELSAELCDVDHTVEWADGGPTDQRNAGARCSSHNVDKTRRRWRARRATNGRSYTLRPDGTIMLPVGARPPTFPDESDDDHSPADIVMMTNLARQRAAGLRRHAGDILRSEHRRGSPTTVTTRHRADPEPTPTR